jgi:hypothetical protein
MREQRIWPNGLRYLWTDAFGLVLLVSLYRDLHEEHTPTWRQARMRRRPLDQMIEVVTRAEPVR